MMKLILKEKSVRDILSQSLGSLRLLLVKYYAWLPGNTLQKSIEGLKRTVIYQALEQYPDLAPILTPRRWVLCQVLRSISGIPTWDEREIEETFDTLLSLCGKSIKLALFVDGLDEFVTPAGEIIKFIQHITVICKSALKICAASRPWTEFQDEFNQGPMLQMHLLTENDMKIFIEDNFKNNKGFMEQRQLNSNAASQLLADIVQRANGVFLWVSIVVNHLSSCFSEGQSISQARRVLEALPTDISSLYDVIWAGIHPNNLPDASYMIQVLRAFDGPMPWLTLWLIEEARFSPMPETIDVKNSSRTVAFSSLGRKLAARTKCILEVSGNANRGFVDFIHRTARDWAIQPKNWELICLSSHEQFDPHLGILKAQTLISTDIRYLQTLSPRDIWNTIARVLWHAGEARDTPKSMWDIESSLHSFKHTIKQLDSWGSPFDIYGGRGRSKHSVRIYKDKYLEPSENRITFLALAAQFSILPYIEAVTIEDRLQLSPSFSKKCIGLLESAIFGYSYYVESSPDDFCPQIPRDRRLATVKFLLEQGVRQSKLLAGYEVALNLREELHIISSTDPEYYSMVATYLDETDFMSSMRSIKLRTRSLFSKSWA